MFRGVVIFSRGASPQPYKQFHVSQRHACELTRIALRVHRATVSRILSIAVLLAQRAIPGLRLIVSFADPNVGHVGAIYRASNWLYYGRSADTTEYYIGGRWRHVRGVFRRIKAATPTRNRVGKYRYALPLDAAMRRIVEELSFPYPRAGSVDGGTPPDQGGGGGSIPTPALSFSEHV